MTRPASGSTAVGPIWAFLVASFLCLSRGLSQDVALPAEWQNMHSEPMDMKRCGDFVYFSADDGVHGREPWRTDGTPEGTVMIGDLQPGGAGSKPEFFTEVGRWTMFVATVNAAPLLWVTRGVPNDTYPVIGARGKPIHVEHAFNPKFGSLGGRAYFSSNNYSLLTSLWIYDPETKVLVERTRPADVASNYRYPQFFAPGESRIYYKWGRNDSFDGALFTLDADDNQISLTNPLSVTAMFTFACIGDRVYFSAAEGRTGVEVWTSDGTADTVRQLKDINPGTDESVSVVSPYGVSLGRLFIFKANDGIHGNEVWVSNGDGAGTQMLRDIYPGIGSSNCGILTAAGRLCFFQANDGLNGNELWVTDGTQAGTYMAKDIYPGPTGSNPFGMIGVGDTLYFSAEDHLRGGELWRSDGTPGGTVPVIDMIPGAEGGWAKHKADLNGTLVFGASDTEHGVELWATDGTKDGTRLLKDIWPIRGPNPSSDPGQLISVGGLLFFVVNDATHGAELWKSDGTHAGTHMVKDIFPGPASASPSQFCAFGKFLFFQADDGAHGNELWRTNGTPEGTSLFVDLNEGKASSNPHSLIVVGNRLAFVADDGVSGYELFRTNGDLQDVTQLVKDIRPGEAGSNPRHLTLHLNKLYFVADDGEHGTELWVSDLESLGTQLVRDLIPRPIVEGQASRQDDAFEPRIVSVGESLYVLAEGYGAPPQLEQVETNLDVNDRRTDSEATKP